MSGQNHEEVEWQGRRFRRYPDHERRSQRVYFMATNGSREYLHRAIYVHHHGPIPDGWHVHHRDHDPLNNDPDNLVAMSPSAHAELHGRNLPAHLVECAGCGQQFTGHRDWAKWCSPACKERTRRAEGLAYVRPRIGPWRETRSCEECDTTYEARRPWARFCTPACKQRHARKAVA